MTRTEEMKLEHVRTDEALDTKHTDPQSPSSVEAIPSRSPAAVVTGTLIGVGLLALTAVAIREIVVRAGWVDGGQWSVSAARWIGEIRWQDWMWGAAFACLALGLLLLWTALRPRRRTHVAIAGHGSIWTRRVDVARRCSAAASSIPGVAHASTTIGRRKAGCTVQTTRDPADRDLIQKTVEDVVAVMSSPPRVKIRVRDARRSLK